MRRKARKKVNTSAPEAADLPNVQTTTLMGREHAVAAGCHNVQHYLDYCKDAAQEPSVTDFASYFAEIVASAVVKDQVHPIHGLQNAVVAGCAFAHWQIEQENKERIPEEEQEQAEPA